MKVKIKYIFIDGEVYEVEADEEFAAFILLEKIHEESGQRKQNRIKERLRQLAVEENNFASQWGNPEEDLLKKEAYNLLVKSLEDLTFTQHRRLELRLGGLSYTEIAQMENVSVQIVKDSIDFVSKKFLAYMKYKAEE